MNPFGAFFTFFIILFIVIIVIVVIIIIVVGRIFWRKDKPTVSPSQSNPYRVHDKPVPNICPNCGKELEPNQKFCSYCGTEI